MSFFFATDLILSGWRGLGRGGGDGAAGVGAGSSLVRILRSFRTSSTTISDSGTTMQMAHWSADRLAVPSSRWRKPSSVARMIVSTDRPVATRSGLFARMDPPNSDSSSSAVSREEKRRNSAKIVMPIVRATTSP